MFKFIQKMAESILLMLPEVRYANALSSESGNSYGVDRIHVDDDVDSFNMSMNRNKFTQSYDDDDWLRRQSDDWHRRDDDDWHRRQSEDLFSRQSDDWHRRQSDDLFSRQSDDWHRRDDDDWHRRQSEDWSIAAALGNVEYGPEGAYLPPNYGDDWHRHDSFHNDSFGSSSSSSFDRW